jgi:uncharacterized membrane protein YccC
MPERRDGQTTVTALLPPLLGLARRVRDLVQREDPGAQRAALGLRALNAFALAGMAALLIEHGSGTPVSLIMPPVAAVLAVQAIIFETGATRLEAARQITLIIAAGIASLGTATLLVAAFRGLLPVPVGELLLVPASFLMMWLRRYGPLGQGAGIVVFVAAIFAVPYTPTLASLPWIGLAGLVAVWAAVAIRLCSGVPETDIALLARARILREQIAFLLRGCRMALHAAEADELARAAARRGAIRTAWAELRAAVEGELAPGHPSQKRLEAAVLRLYVLNQATVSVAEALAALAPSLHRLGLRDRARLSRALGRIERLALAGPQPAPELLATTAAAQAELKALVVARRELDVLARYALLRIAFATERVVRSLREGLDPTRAAPAAPTPAAPGAAGLAPTTRMGVQAAVASAALVALDAVFHFGKGYWAILSAALVVANSFGDTWRRAVQRGLGTAVGVIAGLAIGPLTGHAPSVMLPAAGLAIALAVITVKARYGLAMALVSFVFVIALEIFLQPPLEVLMARIWETLLGAACGILASAFVLPLRLTAQLTDTARGILARARAEVSTALAAARGGEGSAAPRLGTALLAAWGAEKARFRNLGAETLLRPGGGPARPFLVAQLDAVVEQAALLEDAVTALKRPADEGFAAVAAELAARADAAFAAALARLDGRLAPASPGTDDLLPLIANALPFEELAPSADITGFEAKALVCYHARKLVQILGDLAENLDPPRRPVLEVGAGANEL